MIGDQEDLLGGFFFRIYEFLFTFPNPPPVVHRPHVPERYTIKFVPAQSVNPVSRLASPVISSPAASAISFVSAVSPAVSDYSVVSSANFVIPTACIESNP